MLVKVTARGEQPKFYSTTHMVNEADCCEHFADETGCASEDIKCCTLDFDVIEKARLLEWIQLA